MVKISLHTHTHTHTYIYIYRERERERKGDNIIKRHYIFIDNIINRVVYKTKAIYKF